MVPRPSYRYNAQKQDVRLGRMSTKLVWPPQAPNQRDHTSSRNVVWRPVTNAPRQRRYVARPKQRRIVEAFSTTSLVVIVPRITFDPLLVFIAKHGPRAPALLSSETTDALCLVQTVIRWMCRRCKQQVHWLQGRSLNEPGVVDGKHDQQHCEVCKRRDEFGSRPSFVCLGTKAMDAMAEEQPSRNQRGGEIQAPGNAKRNKQKRHCEQGGGI